MVVGMVGVYALLWGTEVGEQYIRHVLGARFILDLRVRLYGYLQRLSLSFFERTSTGELMSRVTNDLSALEHFVTHGSALTAVDLIRLIGGSIILLVLDWRLAALVLIPVPTRFQLQRGLRQGGKPAVAAGALKPMTEFQ